MKKFGFSKSKGDEEDAQKASLFGSRNAKKSTSPAPQASNPYAAPPPQNDPYARKEDPYISKSGYGGMKDPNPPPYSNDGQRETWRQEKSPVPQGGYGSSSGYGAPKYDNQYGGSNTAYGNPGSRYGRGGYGGFDDDGQKDQLFGGASERQARAPAQQQTQPPGGYGSTYGADQSQGYGAYNDRELTQEELEEEEVTAAKQEIRFMKQQDVGATRNALRLAAQAEETGRDTLARLGAQGERIHNTERNLDLAANQNRLAEEKARELKTLNKSMFAMHVSNPFTAKSRKEARDQAVLDQHMRDREQRDATRAEAWQSNMRQQEYAKEMRNQGRATQQKSSLAERAKYQFEADSEDDEMENEIDSNLTALHGAAGRLKGLATAMGKEVDEQNRHLDRITGKTDDVDKQIAMNRARLDRIQRM